MNGPVGSEVVSADDRNRPAPPHEREGRAVVPAHEVAPVLRGVAGDALHIRIVVAGGRASRPAACRACRASVAARANSESSEMLTRSPVSAMWSGFCACMSRTIASSTSAMMMAMPLAVPVDQPEPALVHQLANVRRFDRSDVRIGKMREGEHAGRYSVEVRAATPSKGDGREGSETTPTDTLRVSTSPCRGGEEAARGRDQGKAGAPEGAPCDGKLGREACRPRFLRVGHRRQRRCDIRVAQIDSRAPTESPLAAEQGDEEEEHGGHRFLLCTAKIGFCRPSNNWNKVGSAMHLGMCIVRIR